MPQSVVKLWEPFASVTAGPQPLFLMRPAEGAHLAHAQAHLSGFSQQ